MGVLWLRAKVQLRGRALASLFLALLVGLAGALVLAATAGARRSEAALPRFLAVNRTVDSWVTVQTGNPADDLAKVRHQLAALPEVRQVFRVSGVVGGLILAGADTAEGAHPVHWHPLIGSVALDPGGSIAFGRPIVAAGRLPDERQPEEAAVDEELAERYHLQVGSRYRVGALTLEQFGSVLALDAVAPQGAVVDLRVVGIVRYPMDLDPVVTDQDNAFVQHGELYLTPAYWRRYGPNIANYGHGLAVMLRHGQADLPRLQADLHRLYSDRADVSSQGLDSGETITAGTRRAIGLETAALAAFALLAALAALLLVGQTLGRQILMEEAADSPILRALGMTRAQLIGVGVVRATPIAAAGATLAVIGAVGLSPMTPLGVARRAALDPGVAVDLPVLVLGALTITVSVLGCAALATWRADQATGQLGHAAAPGAERRSRVAAGLAAAGLPPAAVTGTRLALEPGRGRSAVPVRSAIVAAAAGVAALTLTVTFGASLLGLVGDPHAYGVTWDVKVGGFVDPQAANQAARRLTANPAVAAFAGAVTQPPDSRIDGRAVHLLAFTPGKGELLPAVVEGRAPIQPNEIALGSTTLRELGKQIGDTAQASTAEASQRLRIVGRVLFNNTALAMTAVGPGKGGIVHPHLWRRLSPTTPIVPVSFYVRLDPTSDRRVAIGQLQREFPNTVVFPLKQPDLLNLERVGYLPGLLAGLVALLALGTVAHALVTSVRRRRRDLAILKTLGFMRGQVSQTVAWQATTFALVAGLLGVPLGIAGGRWAWRVVAEQLGVAAGPVVPAGSVLAIGAGALLVANLVAAGPGWTAARIQPATALRSE